MSTRFYLPGTNTPTYSNIPFSGSWTVTGLADKIGCVTSNLGTALADKTTEASSVANSILNRQYISLPLAAQTINGRVTGQLRCDESNAAMNAFPMMCINVYQSGGLNPRGTILPLAMYSVTEIGTNYHNSFMPSGVPIRSVTVQNGDVLVIELGGRQTASSANRTITQRFGENGASDLPIDESTTTGLNPWIEFTADISFYSAPNDGTVSFSNSMINWLQDDY